VLGDVLYESEADHVTKGNAADALVGTTLCVGVIGMISSHRKLQICWSDEFQACNIVGSVEVDSCLYAIRMGHTSR
jgi:hypothetical protein